MFRAGIVLACLFLASIAQAATITAKPTGGRWESGATWDSGTVPTAGDDVVLNASSGNVVVRYSQHCRSLDCLAYTGTLTIAGGRYIGIGYLVEASPGDAAAFGAGMTIDARNGSSFIVGKWGGATGMRGLRTSGKVMPTLQLVNVTLSDSLASSGNYVKTWELFDSDNQPIACQMLRTAAGSIASFGTSQINTSWVGLDPASVVSIANADVTLGLYGYGVVEASHEFGVVTFTRGQWCEVRGDNTFDRIVLTGASAATSINFQGGSTTTLTGANPLPSGDAGGQLSLVGQSNWESGSPSSAWTVSAAIGSVDVEYVTIQDSTATGGAVFSAGVGSVDAGGNSGWGF